MDARRLKPTGISVVLIHIIALLALFQAEYSWWWVALALGSYFVRMFAITAGFHRYFAHKTFKTNRVFQFILGFLGTASIQRGPIWWAAVHRHHHRHSDTKADVHSPVTKSFYQSHIGWVFDRAYKTVDLPAMKDLTRFPELVWLDRYYLLPPMIYAAFFYLILGWQGVVWGMLVSTVFLWHGTFFVNSLTHVFGRRRFATKDHSRNNWFVALLTLGEGWHNNHHFYPGSVRQGFKWWEYDVSYYVLKALSWVGIVHTMKGENVKHILARATVNADLPQPRPVG